MATIALQDGKIITKDGKASCSCCESSPCTGFVGGNILEITRENYLTWLKGGTIFYSVSIYDSFSSEDSCSWSYYNSVVVPPKTCLINISEQGPISCETDYYGIVGRPFINVILGVDIDNETYRAILSGGAGCQVPYYIFGNEYVCFRHLELGNFAYEAGDGIVNFLGAEFHYINYLESGDENTPSPYADIQITFTPNP